MMRPGSDTVLIAVGMQKQHLKHVFKAEPNLHVHETDQFEPGSKHKLRVIKQESSTLHSNPIETHSYR